MTRGVKKGIVVFLAAALLWSIYLPAHAEEVHIESVVSYSETVTVSQLLNVAGPRPGDDLDYLTEQSAVVEAVRQGLENRQESVSVAFTTNQYEESLLTTVFAAAVSHTGASTQGDYLRWQIGDCNMNMEGYFYGTNYYLTLCYTPQYYTTAQQEAELDLAVTELLDELNIYTATDYEKVCAVYDYICENVVYDYAGLAAEESKLIYTAYAALINGTAVCQGYANLFYRLMLELNVDARFIGGKGNGGNHGWNIVKLDGVYYNLDATWDASRAQANYEYDYFLRCEENFVDHVRDDEYLTAEFQSAYPMSRQDYTPNVGLIPGDIDGNHEVNTDDVLYLLLHVGMPDLFQISVPGDFTGDGYVTTDDVLQLLLHIGMPDLFPL